eukprot:3886742-Rhodomonas_salina.1
MAAQSERQYLMDLHGIVAEYSRRSLVAPQPLNLLFLFFDSFSFLRQRSAPPSLCARGSRVTGRGCRRKVAAIFGTSEKKVRLSAQMDQHLRRNVSVAARFTRVVSAPSPPNTDPLLKRACVRRASG